MLWVRLLFHIKNIATGAQASGRHSCYAGGFTVLHSSNIHKISHAGADGGFTLMYFLRNWREIDFQERITIGK